MRLLGRTVADALSAILTRAGRFRHLFTVQNSEKRP